MRCTCTSSTERKTLTRGTGSGGQAQLGGRRALGDHGDGAVGGGQHHPGPRRRHPARLPEEGRGRRGGECTGHRPAPGQRVQHGGSESHPGDDRPAARVHRRDRRPDQPGDVRQRESGRGGGGRRRGRSRASGLVGSSGWRPGPAALAAATVRQEHDGPNQSRAWRHPGPVNTKGRGRHPPRRRPRPWNRSSAPQRRAVGSLCVRPEPGRGPSIPERSSDRPDHERGKP